MLCLAGACRARRAARLSASRLGLAVQVAGVGFGQVVQDGRVHGGLLKGGEKWAARAGGRDRSGQAGELPMASWLRCRARRGRCGSRSAGTGGWRGRLGLAARAVRFLPEGPGQRPGQPVAGCGPVPAGPGRIAGPFRGGRRGRVVCWKLVVHSASPLMRQSRVCPWLVLVSADGRRRGHVLIVVVALG